MTLDFSKLTLQDALDLAIFIEEDASARYREFSEQLEAHNNPEAVEFFRFMVEQENKHGAELRARREEMFGDATANVATGDIPEIETADYDTAHAFMSPHAALRVALASEVRAHDFYDDALGHVTDEAVKKLFTELRAEELDHQAQIKKVMEKLPPEDKSNPDDFADEPVAH
jgi:rubrerythrin